MPALQPPSMQIGVTQPGFNTLTPLPSGPQRGVNNMPAAPTILQSAGATTSVSGPTNISQTVTSTKVGTYLVWAVAVSASAASALGGTPTGWTLLTSQSVATLSLGLYVWQNNPGAITTVTFSSNATATAGGIASWFWELDNCPFLQSANISANGNSTSPAAGGVTPKAPNSIVLGMTGWVLGAATLTNTSTPGTWTFNAQQSSTNGATNNAALQTGSVVTPYAAQVSNAWTGTLSAGSVWASAEVTLLSLASGGPVLLTPGRSNLVDPGNPAGMGETGTGGWALGGTKPGGAGSGQ